MRWSMHPARRILPLLALPFLLLVATACDDPQSTIAPQSDVGDKVQAIYVLVFWIAVVIFAIVLAGTVAFSVWFREGRGHAARQLHGNSRLEVLWTVIPVIILVVIAVPTFDTIAEISGDPPAGAMSVVATGHQWWFEFEYPEYGFTTANEMHVPVNQPVAVRLLSDDVIHAFWVPRLAGKTDMVPGHENQLWFTPRDPGVYLAQCAEFCGTSHANMRFRVIVQTRQDFDAWVASMQSDAAEPADALASEGAQEFITAGCVGCHAVRGTIAAGVIGPDLTHVGQRLTIASGILDNTAEDLERWLKNPPGVKPGSKMPNLKLSDAQVERLVAYLQSLQ